MRKLLGFAAGAMSVTLVLNLLLQTDLFLVKRLSPIDLSNIEAGLYSVALDLSRLPYQAIAVPAALILLPAISRGLAAGTPAAAAASLQAALRYVLIGVGLCAVLLATNALPLVLLVFKPIYAGAALPLRIAPFGVLAFCLFYVFATALIGSGRPLHAAAIGAVTLVIDIALNTLLIPPYGLTGAAAATALAVAAGTILAAVHVNRTLGAVFPLATLGRTLLAGLLVAGASTTWEAAGLLVIVKCALLGLLFLGLLVLFRELTRDDLARVRSILPSSSR
jgi:O-antigen/teichoic acid export membrane protein